ncbi:Mysoin-binding motif of peroxisomes-domain-containing protein [Phialemonium atrogriseum]|uniref:Vezatin n=1 Tax=Phialemonium atrogriseum TaxID=1093897 RepID=A0AAJ0C1D8_9PEZI|nr:Mysoin-binding motif of peroxisomes-domain-containing protein [Phialemonium atrogriseum]KAK1768339.1 Mysoin-binding motif of peroxisomes-domain-containing protein [Phialemonium atrogriseum]
MADEGDEKDQYDDWATPAGAESNDGSPPPSPSFAPVGRPMVKKRFRHNIPNPLRLDTPGSARVSSLQGKYSRAVASRIDRADNSKFLEQFRYTIVASQLLSGHSILAQKHFFNRQGEAAPAESQDANGPTSIGLLLTATAALTLAWVISWVYSDGWSHLAKKRVLFTVGLLVAAVILSHAYIRQQWLRYLRDQAMTEITAFVSRSQDFDSASSAAVALVQEVELVSRGYRISAPLPPISRIEDRSQTRRCVRLRKTLKGRFEELVQKYNQVTSVVKGFSEQLDLEKYYDIYDISDLDISDALQGFLESDFEDAESLRTMKIAAARFHTIRKIFLCALLALEANGDDSDYLRWSTAVEGLRALNEVTKASYERLQAILGEEEFFSALPAAKMPLSPGRERWRSQLMKLNSLSSGIRGLQAKMTLLREESDRSLNDAEDISELAPNLMAQYESIGEDLRVLTHAWEEGKAALASGIDRNEKRLSSMSALLSPTISLSGVTTVDDGGALEALKALTGASPPSSSFGSPAEPEHEEVFEAVAMPRPRSLLTREERVVKMKEDREKRELVREKAEASRGMLRELEMVINLQQRNRPKSTGPGSTRISL